MPLTNILGLRSEVRVSGATTNGSSGYRIRTFPTTLTNTGSDILYTRDTINGDTFTIQTDGVYSISHTGNAGAFDNIGISIGASITTSITSLSAAEVLAMCDVAVSGDTNNAAWTGFLAAGSVIRGHQDGTTVSGSNTAFNQFCITRIS